MKEKVKKLIEKNPFWSGIIVGIIFILLIAGIFQLMSKGRVDRLDKVDQIIQEDYLRLSIRDNTHEPDAARAAWRFAQLGENGSYLLELLKKDSLTDPLALLNFSSIVVKSPAEPVNNLPSATAIPEKESEEKSPGMPIIGMIFFILFGLIVLCLIFLFSISENGKKFWTKILDFRSKYEKEPTSWSIREDSNFDIGTIINRFPEDSDSETDDDDISDFLEETDSMIDTEFSRQDFVKTTDDTEADAIEISEKLVLDQDLETMDEKIADTDIEVSDQMDEDQSENQTDESIHTEDEALPTIPEQNDAEIAISIPENGPNDSSLLIHYQTVYKLGDDLFDETFSLDEQDDRFLGECGIGIAETINNTDPKAVTAFEIWLFDREDVHTPTHFLLSDFAYSNDEILSRLKNKGGFDKISEGKEYLLESQSLKMTVKINSLEYGTESAEKNSYFTKVMFDVCVIKK